MRYQKAATRQLDELGRIVIPQNIRETLEWGTGTKLEISIHSSAVKSIIIKEVAPCCSLCRKKSENLTQVQKGHMCPECLVKIKWLEYPP